MRIVKLKAGETIIIKESGNSMSPLIKSRQPVKVCQVPLDTLKVGDVVYCKVKGRYFLHRISRIVNGRFEISNNKGYINGFASAIFGKVIFD